MGDSLEDDEEEEEGEYYPKTSEEHSSDHIIDEDAPAENLKIRE